MNTYQQLIARLEPLYGRREAKSIVLLVLESAFGLSLTDVVCGRLAAFSSADAARLEQMMRRLEAHEPVQYVLGEAFFAGERYRVEPGVLIPRPETEELCRWVVADEQAAGREPAAPGRLLDCCTGSGCIAITLKKAFPGMRVEAVDVADAALKVAGMNAAGLHADVEIRRQDVLRMPPGMPVYDVIVSNPPYVALSERAMMRPNVLGYEPEIALFVPDDDPLRFYRAIARYGAEALRPGGRLYFEANPLFMEELEALLGRLGYRDLRTKAACGSGNRLLKAVRGSAKNKMINQETPCDG